MDLSAYRTLQATARRCARRVDEAEDLVQDALLAGLEQGRDDAAWLGGTVRNLARMQARTAVRRRRREAEMAAQSGADDADGAATRDPSALPARRGAASPSRLALLAALPPSARRVAVLALHGLSAEEIRCVLGIADTALRQRLTTIRKTLGALPPPLRAEALALAYVRDPVRSVDLQFGLVRRALKAALTAGQWPVAQASDSPPLGTHDMDGHLLVLSPSRPAALRTARRAPDSDAGRIGGRDAHGSGGGGNT